MYDAGWTQISIAQPRWPSYSSSHMKTTKEPDKGMWTKKEQTEREKERDETNIVEGRR